MKEYWKDFFKRWGESEHKWLWFWHGVFGCSIDTVDRSKLTLPDLVEFETIPCECGRNPLAWYGVRGL